MSIMSKCVRFSWEVVENPNHAWGGTNDRAVISLVKARLGDLTDGYMLPLGEEDVEFTQLMVPLVLVLRNSKHPLIAERNFWGNKEHAKAAYYPKDWGTFLTPEERDTVLKGLRIKPEHRFVFHMLPDALIEQEFISRLAMTHALTTYTLPRVMSLDYLASIIANSSFGSADKLIEEIQQVPLLILTSTLGVSDSLRKAAGTITTLLTARMCNGRTTVFTDWGHLHCDEKSPAPAETVSAFGHTKASLNKAIRDNISNVSIMSTPLASFLFGGMTHVMNYHSFDNATPIE